LNLGDRDFTVLPADAAHIRNVPGRKTDGNGRLAGRSPWLAGTYWPPTMPEEIPSPEAAFAKATIWPRRAFRVDATSRNG
jgi:hypothetical protein